MSASKDFKFRKLVINKCVNFPLLIRSSCIDDYNSSVDNLQLKLSWEECYFLKKCYYDYLDRKSSSINRWKDSDSNE